MDNASFVNTALSLLVLSQIIIMYKVFRISAKLEKRKHNKSSQKIQRRGEKRNDNRNRNDKNPNKNRTQGKGQKRNQPQGKGQKQKPQPQRQVSAVDKSLREINLRLKDAEKAQEKTREKLTTSDSPEKKNTNGENRPAKIKRRSDNVKSDNVKKDNIKKDNVKKESQSSNGGDSRIKRRNLIEKPEVSAPVAEKPAVEEKKAVVAEKKTVAPEKKPVEPKNETAPVAEVKPVEKTVEPQNEKNTEEVTFGRR